jgi:hypothetical protein
VSGVLYSRRKQQNARVTYCGSSGGCPCDSRHSWRVRKMAYVIGGILGLLICLAVYYWNKENKE